MTTFKTPGPKPESCKPLGEVLVAARGDQALHKFVKLIEDWPGVFTDEWAQAGIDQILNAHKEKKQ